MALCSHHERLLEARCRLPVPVLLVSGALGSGKTALLRQLLAHRANLRLTCLVNDLAKLNVDATLLLDQTAAHRTLSLSDGCVCHGLKTEFEGEVWDVLQQTDGMERLDYFVVETSGVADPLALVEMLERRFGKMTRARLDALVMVVDADVLVRDLHALLRGKGAECEGGTQESGFSRPNGPDGREGESSTTAADERGRRAALPTASAVAAASACVPRAVGDAQWRQLCRADFILLNKRDLLTAEDAALLEAAVREATPWAEVVLTEYGDVPLPRLLNVDVAGGVGGGGGLPSHEAEQRAYITRTGLPERHTRAVALRPPLLADGARPFQLSSQAHSEWTAIEFCSTNPFRLGMFQDLIATMGAPWSAWAHDGTAAGGRRAHVRLTPEGWRRVRRIKGVLWFAECRSLRWVFQVSGLQRVQLKCEGEWEGRPAVQLVAIGQHPWSSTAEALREALQEVCGRDGASDVSITAASRCDECDSGKSAADKLHQEAKAVRRRLRACGRFEVFDPDGVAVAGGQCRKRMRDEQSDEASPDTAINSAPCVVHFQLVGAASFGITRRELETRHRVDVNVLTERYVTELNFHLASATHPHPKALLTGAFLEAPSCSEQGGGDRRREGDSIFSARFAVGGLCDFEAVWPAMSQVADAVISKELRSIRLCRCDV